MKDIVCEIQIILRKGAACIIIFVLAAVGDELLVGRNDLIVAAGTVDTDTQPIIDLLAAVNRKHDVGHLTIDKIDFVVCQQKAVRGNGKAEVFAMLFFLRAGVFHDLLHHIEIHQRFAAKEVDLQVSASHRFFDQEIDRFLPHLERHEHSSAAKISLSCKAIFAPEIAVVRNVQTHRLYRSRHHHIGKFLIFIGGKEHPGTVQF